MAIYGIKAQTFWDDEDRAVFRSMATWRFRDQDGWMELPGGADFWDQDWEYYEASGFGSTGIDPTAARAAYDLVMGPVEEWGNGLLPEKAWIVSVLETELVLKNF
jgi:hypothetical protein